MSVDGLRATINVYNSCCPACCTSTGRVGEIKYDYARDGHNKGNLHKKGENVLYGDCCYKWIC
eukprot:gene25453-221_t